MCWLDTYTILLITSCSRLVTSNGRKTEARTGSNLGQSGCVSQSEHRTSLWRNINNRAYLTKYIRRGNESVITSCGLLSSCVFLLCQIDDELQRLLFPQYRSMEVDSHQDNKYTDKKKIEKDIKYLLIMTRWDRSVVLLRDYQGSKDELQVIQKGDSKQIQCDVHFWFLCQVKISLQEVTKINCERERKWERPIPLTSRLHPLTPENAENIEFRWMTQTLKPS